ncbi:hypothetical protein DFH07DRAFT_935396 [Mycena maculata]|uniref:Uncharacterized protein n=1 Tax=Mycena maculata TaxID=230809 RepID=A0AAD7KG52_9AGAR|nr:hypothetical protein DFH07DRAFT_935396 [Mycena maculata]
MDLGRPLPQAILCNGGSGRRMVRHQSRHQRSNDPPPTEKPRQYLSLKRVADYVDNPARPVKRPLPPVAPRVKVESVPLPPAPPIPASPPPALTDVDLQTYIAPLITNGWHIRGVTIPETMRQAFPALARSYHFDDTASARAFLSAVATMMPATIPESLGGVRVHMATMFAPMMVSVESLSKLARGAPQEYGPSLADVRFAIQLDNEVANNWNGRVDTSVPRPLFVPKTVEELWKFKKPA